MKIYVKLGQIKYPFFIKEYETVKSLKEQINKDLEIKIESQRLILSGYPLVNEQILKLNENDVINLILQLY
jgi:hypothetical protein